MKRLFLKQPSQHQRWQWQVNVVLYLSSILPLHSFLSTSLFLTIDCIMSRTLHLPPCLSVCPSVCVILHPSVLLSCDMLLCPDSDLDL